MQEPEHRGGMTDGGRGEAGLAPHQPQDLGIEFGEPVLFLFAGAVPGGVPRREFVDVEQIEQLDVVGGHVAIPARHTAARDHDHPRGIHLVAIAEPAQEGHPVQHFVADFGQPRPDDNRRIAPGCGAQLATHGHFPQQPRRHLAVHPAPVSCRPDRAGVRVTTRVAS
jgi:hypothetical protein